MPVGLTRMYAGGHESSAAGKRTHASDRIGPSGTNELAVIHPITVRVEFAGLLHTGDTALPEAVRPHSKRDATSPEAAR